MSLPAPEQTAELAEAKPVLNDAICCCLLASLFQLSGETGQSNLQMNVKVLQSFDPCHRPCPTPIGFEEQYDKYCSPCNARSCFSCKCRSAFFFFFYRQTSPDTSLPTGQPIALPVCGSNIKLVFLIACSFKTKKNNNKKQPMPSNGKGLEIKSRGSRRVFLYYRFQRRNLMPSAEQSPLLLRPTSSALSVFVDNLS